MDIKYRLLGPLHIGGVTRIEPRGQRVLAALLLAAERTVSRDALIDAVWDENPPPTAARQLLNCVCTLRRKLGAGFIVSDALSYQVRATSHEVDAHVFTALTKEAEALRAAGRLAPAVQRLRFGLGLWRGPALAGLTSKCFEPAASRLDEQRLAALESCLELEMTLGRLDVAAELVELLRANPLRERSAGLLMLALQQKQRRADALKVYRSIRSHLSEELGLEPGLELQALHLAILRGDQPQHTGAVTQAIPRQLPAAIRHFVGRRDELAALHLLAGEVGQGGLVMSLIDGESGVGKTTLAVHFAHEAAGRFRDGQLYADLGRTVDPGIVIQAFLDSFGVPVEHVPAAWEARAGLYRTIMADRNVLVLLDNVADAAQVRPLLPGGAASMVLITSRRPMLELTAEFAAEQLTLSALSRAEARELLLARTGRGISREAVEEILAWSRGLPSALSLAGAQLATARGK